MRPISIISPAIGAFALLVACSEEPQGPDSSPTLAFDISEDPCPIPADFVATDEASLLAALAAANPGQVIALDGFFAITATVVIATDDVTLTCATPGSGVFAQPTAGVGVVLWPSGARVTIDRLVIDGSQAVRPINSQFTEGVHITNNRVTCGTGLCAFFHAVTGGAIQDNFFESYGSGSGVHVQAGVDGTRIEGNTVIARSPQTGPPVFGGIRARDGNALVIAGNRVEGPWHNSIHLTNLFNSQLKDNQLGGATWDGILMFPNSPPDARTDNNYVRNNKVTGAGEAGVWADRACGNVFWGNNLNGNANDWGLVFTELTGANTLVGNQNVVVDDGAYDCDGDSGLDPNIITGARAVLNGLVVGKEISEAASAWNDVK